MDCWRTARCSNIPEEAHMREVSAVLCALLLTAAAGCGGSQPSTASPSPIVASNSSQPPAAPGACVIGFDDLRINRESFASVHRMRPLRRRDRRDVAGLHHVWSSRPVHTVPVGCRIDDDRRSRGGRDWRNVCVHLVGYLFEHYENSGTKITGSANGAALFTIAKVQGNTYGEFATIVNPQPSAAIDALRIRLTNAAAPCCSNPVGLDEIRVIR